MSAAAIDERYGARRGGAGARSGHLDAFDGQGLGDVLKSAKKTKKPYGPGSSARFDDVGDDVGETDTPTCGLLVGDEDGADVGEADGDAVGELVGDALGLEVVATVGGIICVWL